MAIRIWGCGFGEDDGKWHFGEKESSCILAQIGYFRDNKKRVKMETNPHNFLWKQNFITTELGFQME